MLIGQLGSILFCRQRFSGVKRSVRNEINFALVDSLSCFGETPLCDEPKAIAISFLFLLALFTPDFLMASIESWYLGNVLKATFIDCMTLHMRHNVCKFIKCVMAALSY